MAKKGMKRIERTHTKPKNIVPPVPEIQGKAKRGNVSAAPVIAGTKAPSQKVYHSERPISKAYSAIDTDAARDNLENDISKADLQDL